MHGRGMYIRMCTKEEREKAGEEDEIKGESRRRRRERRKEKGERSPSKAVKTLLLDVANDAFYTTAGCCERTIPFTLRWLWRVRNQTHQIISSPWQQLAKLHVCVFRTTQPQVMVMVEQQPVPEHTGHAIK